MRLAHGRNLGAEAGAPVDGGDVEPASAGERLGLLHDLEGELARGREDERGGLGVGPLDQVGNRRREGERLAGPGG